MPVQEMWNAGVQGAGFAQGLINAVQKRVQVLGMPAFARALPVALVVEADDSHAAPGIPTGQVIVPADVFALTVHEGNRRGRGLCRPMHGMNMPACSVCPGQLMHHYFGKYFLSLLNIATICADETRGNTASVKNCRASGNV
ncbi:MAG TPA: hypothetical protein PK078_10585 [Anaerolineales bacterium]|nr:hypothetical protein [Anaerolineales bacterium]